MCRFILYVGPRTTVASLVTEPAHSLIHQSFHSHEREEPLNGDGFGVAWYERSLAPEPGVFRSISPAWNNRNLLTIAPVVASTCILAHVRAASPGLGVSEDNCHPFRHGRMAFMHNGDVGGFAALRRALLARLSDESFAMIRGTTDSEHVFGLFLDRHRETEDADPARRLGAALAATIAEVEALVAEHAPGAKVFLNLVVTDGESAAVSRYANAAGGKANTLYVNRGRRYVCEDGACRIVDTDDAGSVLVASESLTEDDGWEVVPPGSILTIRADRTVASLTV